MLTVLAFHAGAATNVVSNLGDNGPGSLRQALADALPDDTITFSTNGTITLTDGELFVLKSLSIYGPGPTNLAISGKGASRVFNIASGTTGNISGMTIRDGRASDGTPGGVTAGAHGGGIYNLGVLGLSNCVIVGNRSGDGVIGMSGSRYGGDGYPGGLGGNGGGIFNLGMMWIVSCALIGNSTGNGGDGGTGGYPDIVTGYGATSGGPGGAGGGGGGIWNELGMVTLIGCRVTGNSCGAGGKGGNASCAAFKLGDGGLGGSGGGCGNTGTLIASNCTFSGNSGGIGGPGFQVDCGWFRFPNRVGGGGHGGGLFNNKDLTLQNSTLSNNTGGAGGPNTPPYPPGVGGSGGGIFNASNVIVFASTFSGNQTGSGVHQGDGGGICTTSSLNVVSCTLSVNSAYRGGGISNTGTVSGVSTLRNSLVALNVATFTGNDLYGSFNSRGHNLANGSGFTNTASGDQIGATHAPVDPRLAPLADNGGPTQTQALLPGSPALDAGDDALNGSDQRGRPRLSGTHVDIGAYELGVVKPLYLAAVRKLANGAFQFAFTNLTDVSFNVFATTNLAAPAAQWLNLGPGTSVQDGFFEFGDPAAKSGPRRFYQLRAP